MKNLFVVFTLIIFVGAAAAIDVTYPSLADVAWYMPYDQTSGHESFELVAGEDGYALSCFNPTQGEYPANQASPVFDTSGKFGSCLNGTMGWMDIHLIADNGIDCQNLTMSFWVRRANPAVYDINQSRDGGLAYLWEIRDGWPLDETLVDFTAISAVDYQMLQVDYRDGEDKIKVGYNGGGGWQEFSVGEAIEGGDWHNVIVTYKGYWGHQPPYYQQGTDIDLYIDGVQLTDSGFIANGWGHIRLEAFGLGTHYAKSGMGIADDFDDFAIWTRILTADEIAWIASGGAGQPVGQPSLQPPVPVSPIGGVPAGSSGSLMWEAGNDGPMDYYNVYLSTSYEAVSDADCESLLADIDGNCNINILDLREIGYCWLDDAAPCIPDVDPDPTGRVDLGDVAVIAGQWNTSWDAFKGSQTALSYDFAGLQVGTWYWKVVGVKNGRTASTGVVSFEVTPKEFFNMMGWTELGQYQESLRNGYAQDLYNMGIRHAMDNNIRIPYFYPNGIKVALYHNPTEPEDIYGYENNPGNWGYYMYDEPKNDRPEKTMALVASHHDAAHTVDPTRPSLTTLYSTDGVAGSITAYIDTFFDAFDSVTVDPEILCYDHYPYRYGLSGYNGHWNNLEIFRARAIAEGNIPLFCWSETNQGSQSNYVGSPTNKNRLRWSNYSRLAYGVKGLCWFNINMCFVNNGSSYGTRTYTLGSAYNDVAEVNAELNRVGDVLVNLTSTAVYHKNAPSYTTEVPAGHWIQLSSHNLVLGMFVDDAGHDYAMVCNRSDAVSITPTVTFKEPVSAVQVFNEQDGTWSNLTINGVYPNQSVDVQMGPGYGKLLMITRP